MFEDTKKEIIDLLEDIHGPKLYIIKRFIIGLTKK